MKHGRNARHVEMVCVSYLLHHWLQISFFSYLFYLHSLVLLLNVFPRWHCCKNWPLVAIQEANSIYSVIHYCIVLSALTCKYPAHILISVKLRNVSYLAGRPSIQRKYLFFNIHKESWKFETMWIRSVCKTRFAYIYRFISYFYFNFLESLETFFVRNFTLSWPKCNV